MGPNKRSVRMAMVVLAVPVALVTSCGDSGPERLTRAQFVAQGDKVCEASDKRLQAAFAEEFAGEGDPTPEQMQAVLRRVAPITETTVARLQRLEPPANLEKRFEAALADAARGIAVLRKAGESPESARALFADDEDPFARANEGFEAVGITRCSPGDTS